MASREFRDRSTRFPLRVRALAVRLGDEHGPVPDTEPAEGWTENLNGRGLYVELDRPAKTGSRLLVTLELPLSSAANHLRLECLCRVVRATRQSGGRYGMGVAVEEVLFPAKE